MDKNSDKNCPGCGPEGLEYSRGEDGSRVFVPEEFMAGQLGGMESQINQAMTAAQALGREAPTATHPAPRDGRGRPASTPNREAPQPAGLSDTVSAEPYAPPAAHGRTYMSEELFGDTLGLTPVHGIPENFTLNETDASDVLQGGVLQQYSEDEGEKHEFIGMSGGAQVQLDFRKAINRGTISSTVAAKDLILSCSTYYSITITFKQVVTRVRIDVPRYDVVASMRVPLDSPENQKSLENMVRRKKAAARSNEYARDARSRVERGFDLDSDTVAVDLADEAGQAASGIASAVPCPDDCPEKTVKLFRRDGELSVEDMFAIEAGQPSNGRVEVEIVHFVQKVIEWNYVYVVFCEA